MPSKSYKFFDNYVLRIPWASGGVSKSVEKDIVWDEHKTQVVSATLKGKIFASGGTQARMSFNGSELIFCDATLGDRTVQDTVDIAGLIINGSNECLIEIWKNPFLPLEKIGRFSAEVIVEYEGESPEMKPTWEKYVMPAVAVASLGVGVVGLAVSLKKEGK